MKVIESPVGQEADNLGDALFRSLLPDGRPMLQTLHAEGMIKKVQAKQVVVTPNASSHVNLDEMNGIIRKMKMGEQAIKEMADIDANRGITGKARRRDDFGREVGAPVDGIRAGSAAVALTLYQDLDGDGRMGANIVGLPTEPWGSSGTPGTFGPSWETGRVKLDGSVIVVRMST
jgi:uncharacterized protein (DUF2141 family)